MSGNESGTEQRSEVETDKEWLLQTLTEVSDQRVLQDIRSDPKIQVCDHEDNSAPKDTDQATQMKMKKRNRTNPTLY